MMMVVMKENGRCQRRTVAPAGLDSNAPFTQPCARAACARFVRMVVLHLHLHLHMCMYAPALCAARPCLRLRMLAFRHAADRYCCETGSMWPQTRTACRKSTSYASVLDVAWSAACGLQYHSLASQLRSALAPGMPEAAEAAATAAGAAAKGGAGMAKGVQGARGGKAQPNSGGKGKQQKPGGGASGSVELLAEALDEHFKGIKCKAPCGGGQVLQVGAEVKKRLLRWRNVRKSRTGNADCPACGPGRAVQPGWQAASRPHASGSAHRPARLHCSVMCLPMSVCDVCVMACCYGPDLANLACPHSTCVG